VSAELVPSQRCSEITDEAQCVAAGCTALETVRAIDDACACGEPELLCVWAPGELTGTDDPRVYWRLTDNEALVFSRTFDTPPYGWLGCNEFGNHEACDCMPDAEGDPCID
jgi:hypothetical protein